MPHDDQLNPDRQKKPSVAAEPPSVPIRDVPGELISGLKVLFGPATRRKLLDGLGPNGRRRASRMVAHLVGAAFVVALHVGVTSVPTPRVFEDGYRPGSPLTVADLPHVTLEYAYWWVGAVVVSVALLVLAVLMVIDVVVLLLAVLATAEPRTDRTYETESAGA